MSVFSTKHKSESFAVRNLSLARGLKESDGRVELLEYRVRTQSGISRIIIRGYTTINDIVTLSHISDSFSTSYCHHAIYLLTFIATLFKWLFYR